MIQHISTNMTQNERKTKTKTKPTKLLFVIVCSFYVLKSYLIGKSWSVFPTFVLYDLLGEFLLFAQQCMNECAISYLT